MLLFVVPWCAGCGSGVGDVTGKVTYRGKPLVGGTVTLLDPGGGFHQGDIGEDGTYVINAVPVGDSKVSVTYVDPQINEYAKELVGAARSGPEGRASMPDSGKPKPRTAPKLDESKLKTIPDHYSDFEKSGLRTTVSKGPNTYDITLK